MKQRATKIKQVCFICLLGLTVMFSPAVKAETKETIIWSRMDFVPFYILDGPFKNTGIADELLKFFQKHLTNYKHEQQIMTFSRLMNDVKNKKLRCNPLLLKTAPREEIYYYSEPVSPIFTHVIITTRHVKRTTDGVSLQQLLEDSGGRFIIEKGRSYGGNLDPILRKNVQLGKIEEKTIAGHRALKLLLSGRIDYFMETEVGASYLLRSYAPDQQISVIPLLEDSMAQFGYTVCTRTNIGRKVIEDLNEVLRHQQVSEEYRSILEKWLDRENHARFRAFYDREILKK